MFRRNPETRETRRRRRRLRHIPRDLSPRMLRDIGPDPWPEEPRIPPIPRL